MKKYIYTVLILTVVLLQGCGSDNGFTGTGKGEILHNGYTYPLYNAQKMIRKETGTSNEYPHHSYFHALTLTGRTWDTRALVIIRSKSDRLESGEFHVNSWIVDNQVVFQSGGHITYFPPVKNRPNRISKQMILSDDFVHFGHNFGPSPKRMKLSVTEEGDVFDIDLRYVDCEGNFFITYRGLVPETWN